MLNIKQTHKYKKDIQKVSKYKNFNKTKLNNTLKSIIENKPLPENMHDHSLKGYPKNREIRDFHLNPDIVVIYEKTPDSIILIRIGKHNTLELTETIKHEIKE